MPCDPETGRWRPTTPPTPIPGRYVVNVGHKTDFGASDALTLYYDDPFLITSPNVDFIPLFDHLTTELRPRLDGKFGMEDYCQHPQVYHPTYPWLPCIRRKPSLESDRERHEFWPLWQPRWATTWNVYGGVFNAQGIMNLQDWDILTSIVMRIKDHASSLHHDPMLPPVFHSTVTALLSGLERLCSYPMSLQDYVLQRAQVQRMALDVDAMVIYQTKFAKWGGVSSLRYKADLERMGAFTNNPTIAESLLRAGLPVWLVRDAASTPPNTFFVYSVQHGFHAPVDVIGEEWFDTRTPDQFRQYVPYDLLAVVGHEVARIVLSRTMGRLFTNLLPFAVGTAGALTEDQLRHPFPQLTPVSPVLAASSYQPPDQAYEDVDSRVLHKAQTRRGATRGPRQGRVVKHQAGGASKMKILKVPSQLNRDKFGPCASDVYPVQLQEWNDALARVDRSRKSSTLLPKDQSGYMFPEPGLLAVQDPIRRRHSMTLWLAFRPSRMSQVLLPPESHPRLLESASWRQFFWLARNHGHNPASTRALSPDEQRAMTALQQMFSEKTAHQINLNVLEVSFYQHHYPVTPGAPADIQEAQITQMLWELSEIGFQYDLFRLDRAAAPHKWTPECSDDRFRRLFHVFTPHGERKASAGMLN
ncbi:hypothetical protein HWV62_29354 [Athelia sp. TMB]|nr:hypothetical protein HWV62_29354 [Athelia sp. TMB]